MTSPEYSTGIESPATAVSGLTTPHLKSGEFPESSNSSLSDVSQLDKLTDAQSKPTNSNTQAGNAAPSVFEISLELDQKLKDMAKVVELLDKEINSRLDTLLSKVKALEDQCRT